MPQIQHIMPRFGGNEQVQFRGPSGDLMWGPVIGYALTEHETGHIANLPMIPVFGTIRSGVLIDAVTGKGTSIETGLIYDLPTDAFGPNAQETMKPQGFAAYGPFGNDTAGDAGGTVPGATDPVTPATPLNHPAFSAISARARNVAAEAGVNTLGDAAMRTKDFFKDLKGFPAAATKALEARFAECGLAWGMTALPAAPAPADMAEQTAAIGAQFPVGTWPTPPAVPQFQPPAGGNPLAGAW